MAQIEELCANPISMHSSEQIQSIIMFLQRAEGLSKHVDSFMQMLSFVQQKDTPPFVLTPLLSDELREANFLGYCSICSFLYPKELFCLSFFVYDVNRHPLLSSLFLATGIWICSMHVAKMILMLF